MSLAPLLALAEQPQIQGDGCCQKLARFFLQHEGQWIDGLEIAKVAGAYASRTRISNLRYPPYSMRIENRQRKAEKANGEKFTISEYRYVENR